jgi:ribosomal-protein-alanine N-acetyltransferase
MNVELRRMQTKDIDHVYSIETQLFADAWSKSSFLYEIKNKKYAFPYVLILNNMIIGYFVCWYFQKELHIGNVAIRKEMQGKGYGKFLILKIFELFPDYENAFLEVNVKNVIAIGLYMKFGFNIISTRKSYYRNGEDALVMVKNKDSD